MPNWCSTTVLMYSKDKMKIESAHAAISEYFNKNRNENSFLSMMSAVVPLFNKDMIGRSFINWVGDIEIRHAPDSKTYWTFSFDLQDAWAPYPTELAAFADFFVIDYVYVAEEPGCLVYINSDTEGLFFDWKYVLDCDWEHAYYSEEQNLVKDFNRYYSADCKTFDECRDYISRNLNDEWIVIEKFGNP